MAPDPLNVRLPEAEEAQLAQHAEQIAVPPGTLARALLVAILEMIRSGPELLEGIEERLRAEVLQKCRDTARN